MNIFIANLNPLTQVADMQKAFEAFGIVKGSRIMLDWISGQSQCFGFVEMQNEAEANYAIQALDSSELHGNYILVRQVIRRNHRGQH